MTIKHLSFQDFGAQVALGNVEGVNSLLLVGRVPVIVAGDGLYTVWDAASTTNKLYTYLTADTGLFLSSSSAADTMLVFISGMDDTFSPVTQLKTLTGQTPIAIGTDLFRVFEIRALGATEPLGDIYLTSTSDVTGGVPDNEDEIKSKIIQGRGKSNMGLVTVPAGKTMTSLLFRVILSKGASVTIETDIRPQGGFFAVEGEFPGYQNNLITDVPGRFAIPEKTDIEIRASAVDVNTSVFFSNDLHAYDNSLIGATASFTNQWDNF